MFALADRMIGMYESLLFDLDVNISIIGILALVEKCYWLGSNRNILSGNEK